jgi:hypothetical protein
MTSPASAAAARPAASRRVAWAETVVTTTLSVVDGPDGDDAWDMTRG